MTKIKDIVRYLESEAPSAYQEAYDNAGLLVGDAQQNCTGILITLDITEEVVEEAHRLGFNMIVGHHPIIFKGLKRLTGKNYVERTVIKAVQHGVALFAAHTNLDNVKTGVNAEIARRLGLQKLKILAPKSQTLGKLTTFIPTDHTQKVLEALGAAGAGQIGNYKNCSFVVNGKGTFQPTEEADPYIGETGKLETVSEDRVEVIFPLHMQSQILQSLQQAHPYEEVAYYLHQLENKNQEVGAGMTGLLPKPMKSGEFLQYLKQKMQLSTIRYTDFEEEIHKVAICGGAGSFLLSSAKKAGAQAFVTGDFKYHEFFDAEGEIMIADIGHYESEVFTKELFYALLNENFSNIALRLSEIDTNPIKYF